MDNSVFHGGWVALHRSVRNHDIYQNPNMFRIFLTLLLCVSYQDLPIENVIAGTIKTTCKHLASITGLSEQQTKSALQKLIKLKTITIKSTNKNSTIRLINWHKYQVDGITVNQQSSSRSNLGWIKIHRNILDTVIYQNHNFFRVFVHLSLKATYKEYLTLIGDTPVRLFPGQLLSGRKKLAEETKLSEQKIRTTLKHLIKIDAIKKQSFNKYSIFTITLENKLDISTSRKPSNNQQQTTYNKVNNKKKDVDCLLSKFNNENSIIYPSINSLNSNELKLIGEAYNENILTQSQIDLLQTKGLRFQ